MRLTDKPLKIEGNLCGKRIVDSLYKVEEDYYFLDIGWTDTPTHPDHPIGKLVKEDKDRWVFKDGEDDDRMFVITSINDDDVEWGKPMIEVYYSWKKCLKEKYPNADGADFIRRDFGLGDKIIKQVG